MISALACANIFKVVKNSYNFRERKPVKYVDDGDDDEEFSEKVEDDKGNAKDPSFKVQSKERWENLLLLHDPITISNSYICKNCKTNFNKNYTPSNCIVNKMYTDEFPSEILVLNDYEKV